MFSPSPYAANYAPLADAFNSGGSSQQQQQQPTAAAVPTPPPSQPQSQSHLHHNHNSHNHHHNRPTVVTGTSADDEAYNDVERPIYWHLAEHNTDPLCPSSEHAAGGPGHNHQAICIGCGHEIFDRYILRVAPDLEWHASCLRCVHCHRFLDESCTAFIRDGKPFCKADYVRLFGAKCAKCGLCFAKNDCVMRAKERMYHMECFRCVYCQRRLMPGDEFALRHDEIYCRTDHEMLLTQTLAGPIGHLPPPPPSVNGAAHVPLDPTTGGPVVVPPVVSAVGLAPGIPPPQQQPPQQPPQQQQQPTPGILTLGGNTSSDSNNNSAASTNKNATNTIGGQLAKLEPHCEPNGSSADIDADMDEKSILSSHSDGFGSSLRDLSSSLSHHPPNSTGGVGGGRYGLGSSKKDKKDKTKTTRIRTVLNERQLQTLRSCYQNNPRPDALIKEQLVELTGLNPRVIRVWFQNKRCKDKKRQIAIKNMQQQHEKNQALAGVRLQGIGPLIVSPGGAHSEQLGQLMHTVDVQQMQQSPNMWTPIHPGSGGDGDGSGGPGGTNAFQQLMHGFGDDAHLHKFGMPTATSDSQFDADLDSFSPGMAASDLSSASCSD